jgi:Rieske Fe-S protein
MEPSRSISAPDPGRRRALALFVNAVGAAIGAALATVLGVFALKPAAAAGRGKWIRAASLAELPTDRPVARVLSVARPDGWYRERSRQTVFLVRDGDRGVKALSATCTHLGCQVRWDGDAKKFICPCHGGVYAADGRVLEGPPPRPLDTVDVRVEAADDSVLVRV